MKKTLIVVLAVAILAAAGIALAGISGSQHDVRVANTNGSLEPCAYCHTPHGGNNNIAPLWNRSQDNNTYTIYTSSSFDAYDGVGGTTNATLDKGSAPCMVCHNGVASALINFPGRGNLLANSCYNTVTLNTFSNLGNNLRNEHPISFTYNAAADAEGNNFPTGAGGTIPGALAGTGTVNFPLYAASGAATSGIQFSCATCHAVHHTPVASYAAGSAAGNQVFFLRSSNTGSGLCGSCHRNRL